MSPIRILTILFLAVAALLSVAICILMSQGTIPMFNPWSDLLVLLMAFCFAGMAIMAAFEESNIERAARHHRRMIQLDQSKTPRQRQKLWDVAHNPKALRALERQ